MHVIDRVSKECHARNDVSDQVLSSYNAWRQFEHWIRVSCRCNVPPMQRLLDEHRDPPLRIHEHEEHYLDADRRDIVCDWKLAGGDDIGLFPEAKTNGN